MASSHPVFIVAALALSLTACASHTALNTVPAEPALVTPVREYPAPAASQVQVSRYTSAVSRPTAEQIEPLQAIVQITLPRDVQTIGAALDYVLMRTGYSLGSATTAAQERFRSLPIPESQRVLGPYSVELVLQALLGTEWQLVTNHLQRVVSFVEPPLAIGG